ncbi:energy transducer TonB [Flavobacterium sp. MAH-1]|uniref:Energy transducer TonB n=1 Tax=Flavobacterium agri TaxID=2743471 RepID=A0A7Y8Y258_9FLAO|nr:energy transducer TonB [Flavobacterium agri]NUY80993.1 energy transducer TonB [Flavobacterium agri]NYA71017.1 energy transducer TonB [Flavobacterium agri]
MSRTSIFEKRWLDLVFEGKNKAYGAYQLRLENPRTTLLAFFYGLLFIGGISGAGFLFSSFKSAPPGNLPEIPNDTIVLVNMDPPVQPEPPMVEPRRQPEAPPTSPQTPASWEHPVIVPEAEATPDPQPVGSPAETPGTTATGNPTTGAAAPGAGEPGIPNEPAGPVITTALDKQPSFPGGINEFYKKVAKGFNNPDMEDNAAVRIIVSFVIEKDGRMTDIKVLNKPGEKFEKEAIRVLKSIKDKWEPGVRNHQEMRTLFTLPITIKAE